MSLITSFLLTEFLRFPDFETAQENRTAANSAIESILQKTVKKLCRDCGKPLNPLSTFDLCDSCFRERRY